MSGGFHENQQDTEAVIAMYYKFPYACLLIISPFYCTQHKKNLKENRSDKQKHYKAVAL